MGSNINDSSIAERELNMGTSLWQKSHIIFRWLVDVSLSVTLDIKSHAVVEKGRQDLFVNHVSALTETSTVMLQQ
jgi:hypothetical protein